MSVQAMKFVSMIGPIERFDAFILEYVLGSDIQLERAYDAIEISGLTPFYEENQYEPYLKRMSILNEELKSSVREYKREEIASEVLSAYDFSGTTDYLEQIDMKIKQHRQKIEQLKREIEEREQILLQIQPVANLNVDLDKMFHVRFMKFRFGKMPKANYQKQKVNFDKLDVIVIPVSETDSDVWLSYFTPEPYGLRIDSVFSAIGFERIRISDRVEGTPSSTIQHFKDELSALHSKLDIENVQYQTFLQTEKPNFESLYNRIIYLHKAKVIKGSCSHTKDTFFVVGWMPVQAYEFLKNEVEPIWGVLISGENPSNIAHSKPPTILKNARIFKPFESLVTMYGLPTHNEMDPTKFVMFTFVFMFGFMFGDVGQGALIAIAGAVLYFVKKLALGGVMMYVGMSSIVFGFLYGSIFGNEHVLKAVWLSPIESSDNINLLLGISIGYGAIIILITIIFNIINAYRTKDWGRMLFDRNGLAGLVFYGGLLTILVLSLMTGKLAVTGLVLGIVMVLPLALMFLKEPLEHLIEKKRPIMPAEKGMYFTESGFEVFETLLGFLSNTISFVRVSALALNHAGLSLAVWTIYHMMDGIGGIVALILGNLLIIGLEGMIVGIQCLRLEYYEMFGRYYKGEGYSFKPLQIKQE